MKAIDLIQPCLEYSKNLVEARIKNKPSLIIDLEKEEKDFQQIVLAGELMGIKKTLKKIKNHGKESKNITRSRRRSS